MKWLPICLTPVFFLGAAAIAQAGCVEGGYCPCTDGYTGCPCCQGDSCCRQHMTAGSSSGYAGIGDGYAAGYAMGAAIGEWLFGNPSQDAVKQKQLQFERELEAQRFHDLLVLTAKNAAKKAAAAKRALEQKKEDDSKELLGDMKDALGSGEGELRPMDDQERSALGKHAVLFRDVVNAPPAELTAALQEIDLRIRILYAKGVLNLTTEESGQLARLEEERGKIWKTAVANPELSPSERQSLRLRLLTDSSEEIHYQPMPQTGKAPSLMVRLENGVWKAGKKAVGWMDQKLAPWRGELAEDETPLDFGESAQKVIDVVVPKDAVASP
jgi:hypothetical protein